MRSSLSLVRKESLASLAVYPHELFIRCRLRLFLSSSTRKSFKASECLRYVLSPRCSLLSSFTCNPPLDIRKPVCSAVPANDRHICRSRSWYVRPRFLSCFILLLMCQSRLNRQCSSNTVRHCQAAHASRCTPVLFSLEVYLHLLTARS